MKEQLARVEGKKVEDLSSLGFRHRVVLHLPSPSPDLLMAFSSIPTFSRNLSIICLRHDPILNCVEEMGEGAGVKVDGLKNFVSLISTVTSSPPPISCADEKMDQLEKVQDLIMNSSFKKEIEGKKEHEEELKVLLLALATVRKIKGVENEGVRELLEMLVLKSQEGPEVMEVLVMLQKEITSVETTSSRLLLLSLLLRINLLSALGALDPATKYVFLFLLLILLLIF